MTDLLIDPFNPGRLIAGLGNIGQHTASTTAGVWKSTNGGLTWTKQLGGDTTALKPTNLLPEGTGVGRVTLAQGSGRVGDERFVYVMMSNAAASTNTVSPEFTAELSGLIVLTSTLVLTGPA